MPNGSEGTRIRSIPTKGPNTYKVRSSKVESGQVVTSRTATPWPFPAWDGTQKTVSSNHNFHRRKAGKGDYGGPFFSQRRFVETNISTFNLRGNTVGSGGWPKVTDVYTGACLPSGISATSSVWPPYSSSSSSSLNAYGAMAIASCKPTNQVADVATFIAELVKDGIPEVVSNFWRDGAINAKRLADMHLDFEFALRPIATDVGKFFYDVAHTATVLKQWERDAGRNVRRQFRFPVEVTETYLKWNENAVPWVGSPSGLFQQGVSATGTTIRTRKTVRRRWFSGAFTYPYPKDDKSLKILRGYADALQKADMTLGLTPSLETIWELVPWSWAVDWFSSAGDVVSNLQSWADDGLVLRYGYLMEHSFIRDTYTFSGPTNLQMSDVRPDVISFVTETKLRQKASPFGFGLTWSGLSPRQLAIAASLGITKS